MSDLVGNPEGWFSLIAALIVLCLLQPSEYTHPVVIDEIGKMELFSRSFQQAVKELLKHPKVTVFATIPAPGKANPFVEEIRHRDDVSVFTVSIAESPSVCFSYLLIDFMFYVPLNSCHMEMGPQF